MPLTFLPILLNMLNIDPTALVDATTGGAASGAANTVKEGVDTFIKERTDAVRGWFKAQAYGAIDISLVVMGICLAGIVLVTVLSKDVMSVGEAAAKVASANA